MYIVIVKMRDLILIIEALPYPTWVQVLRSVSKGLRPRRDCERIPEAKEGSHCSGKGISLLFIIPRRSVS